MTLRLVFMGTPDFAVPALRALLAAGHEIAAVYTQPPRAAGRGLQPRKSPVQIVAEEAGLPVLHPTSLRSEVEVDRFAAFGADAAVVVAYGLLLPPVILTAPKHGCLNLHASLLPRWRGAAPMQRAIMAGDSETGISVMRMEEGLDTGAVCMERRVPLTPDTTAGALHDQLAALGGNLIVEALQALAACTLQCKPQSDASVTYAGKITAADTCIDWTRSAPAIHAQIRALSPQPGAWFEAPINGKRERIKVLAATLADISGTAGTLLDDKLTVACGEGAVRLTRVQRAGKKPVPAEEFLRGAKLGVGQELG